MMIVANIAKPTPDLRCDDMGLFAGLDDEICGFGAGFCGSSDFASSGGADTGFSSALNSASWAEGLGLAGSAAAGAGSVLAGCCAGF